MNPAFLKYKLHFIFQTTAAVLLWVWLSAFKSICLSLRFRAGLIFTDGNVWLQTPEKIMLH